MTRRAAFWLLVAAQALVPFGIAGLNEAAIASSRDVLLQVEPVDPLDPFRGEYVSLRYRISRLDAPAGTVYVPLYETGDGWTGSTATTREPDAGTFIRGRSDGRGRIVYGIESFYVPEGKADGFGSAVREHRLFARVAIDRDGRGRVRELVIR